MAQLCPNCQQPVLATDTTCWQCGQALSADEMARETVQTQDAPSAALPELPIPVSAFLFYSGLLAVVVIGLVWVVGSLRQRPLIIINRETNLELGWQPVTDEARSFTFDAPPEWVWRGRAAADFEELVNTGRYAAVVEPLAAIIPDAIPRLIAAPLDRLEGAGADGFVLVLSSRRFNRLSPDEMGQFLRANAEGFTIVEMDSVEGLTGRQQVHVQITIPGDEITCWLRATPGPTTGFLLATCAADGRFANLRLTFEDVLASFQVLRAP